MRFHDLKQTILNSVHLVGSFNEVMEKDDAILSKRNFNMADLPPGFSDPDFVRART